MPSVSDYVIIRKSFEWISPSKPARMLFFLPSDLANSQAVLHYTLRLQYSPDPSVVTVNVKVNGTTVDSSFHNPLHEPNPEVVHGAISIVDAAHLRPIFGTAVAEHEIAEHVGAALPSSGGALGREIAGAQPIVDAFLGFNVIEFEQQHGNHGALVGEVVLDFRRDI